MRIPIILDSFSKRAKNRGPRLGPADGRVVLRRPSAFKGGGCKKKNREELDIFLDSSRVKLFYISELQEISMLYFQIRIRRIDITVKRIPAKPAGFIFS